MRKFYSFFAVILLFTALHSVDASAQAVEFPQMRKPDAANASESNGTYVLYNDVLTASFKATDGKLIFDGCPELGLKEGTELFKIVLGDGRKVSSSEMTLTSCEIEMLQGDETATVASESLDGFALKAHLTFEGLEFDWSAILRDGSHYLRSALTISANSNVAMKSIVPLWYGVSKENAPEVVGNTRGAVLMSESIFAGLETPTGYNSIEAGKEPGMDIIADSGFSFNSWKADSSTADAQYVSNPAYFTWKPGAETPQAIQNLGRYYKEDNCKYIAGKRGFINVAQSGNHTVKFQYSSGTHRLNTAGVDLVNMNGEIVASDYHAGYTGGAASNNTYTLNVPKEGTYLVRYFVYLWGDADAKPEGVTSTGTITWSPTVTAASGPATSPNLTVDAGFSLKSWSPDTNNSDATSLSNPAYFTWVPGNDTPQGIKNLGYYYNTSNCTYIRGKRGYMKTTQSGTHTVKFQYTSGTHRLNVAGVDLINSNGDIVASDYHAGYTGGAASNNTYTLNIPEAGTYIVRYFISNKVSTDNDIVTSTGTITWTPDVQTATGFPSVAGGDENEDDETVYIQGLWSRETTLEAGKTWTVSSVVGLVAPGQARRSFLAYSERERAVPWRPFPHYNSWYELNINRNNSPTYSGHMTATDCADVVQQWKNKLFDAQGAYIKAFVWDDGWDEYGTWDFNPGFPNGFKEPYELAKEYGTGTGAWLGPVGGYGNSGTLRRQYWQNKGGMVLSNPAYYNVFLGACSRMVNEYDFNFFKLDGISEQFSAVGPDAGATGNENAEGIISVLSAVREIRPDMFFNTTVGTWASPFWFHFTDAVWRQEADWSTIGNQGNDRERWITYRDHLVYKNFVQNSPICPINTLMTHGVILTTHGDVSKTMDYDGILREIRCAFACGSGMVELYCDYSLLNSINGGKLWSDLAECIKWQEKNADVLPDIHWVGGNPWDGSKANVYGWASWNGQKATLALRNPSTSPQTYTFTLRQALDVPGYDSDEFTFEHSFNNQAELPGLTTGMSIDLDAQITVTLPGSSVYVFDGMSKKNPVAAIDKIENDNDVLLGENTEANQTVYDLLGRKVNEHNLMPGIYIKAGKKILVK